MNAIVSGLTGAGKSGATAALASFVDLEMVSGSSLRAEMLGLSDVRGMGRQFWLVDDAAVQADVARTVDGRLEEQIDDVLVKRHDREDGLAFDAWFIAWRVSRPSFRVWLEAPLRVRALRVGLATKGTAMSPSVLERLVDGKDERSRDFGFRQYGVDIRTDRLPFTVTIDTTVGERREIEAAIATLAMIWDGRTGVPMDVATTGRFIVDADPLMRAALASRH